MPNDAAPFQITKKQRIQEELLVIQAENRDKLLLANEIVLFAQANEDSALHTEFEWDLTKAAYAQWLSKARQLIRVYVEMIQPDTEPVRVWVSLLADRVNRKGGGYRLTTNVLIETDQRAALLKQAMEEAYRWRRKYAALQELDRIFQAIDNDDNEKAA